MNRLAGKTALVTGSTSNIGRAIALAFAAEGAHVVVTGRNTARGDEVVATIRTAGGTASFIAADLDGSAAASQDLATRATAALGGRIDVLVNNHAIFPAENTAATTEDVLDRVWAVNIKAPFLLTQAIAPGMVERGTGAIIMFSSWLARLGAPDAVVYNATKGATDTLTRDWAAAYGPHGVRVNALLPGSSAVPCPAARPRGPRSPCAVPRPGTACRPKRLPPARFTLPPTRPATSTAPSSKSTAAAPTSPSSHEHRG